MPGDAEQAGLSFPEAYIQGSLLLHRGDLTGAKKSLEAALEQVRRSNDARLLASVLGNLGNVYAALNETEKARALYREILDLQRKNPDTRITGQTLVNLGNLSRELGDVERARAYYLEAEELLLSIRDDFSLGTVYGNLGLLEMDRHNPTEAEYYYKKSIDLHKKTGNEEGLAASWGQLGRAYRLLGRDDRAETCFNYSFTHFGQIGQPSGEVEALRGLADIYEHRKEPEMALRCMTRIRERLTQSGLRVPTADSDREERLQESLHPKNK